MGVPPWVLLTVAAIGLLGSAFGALAALGGVILTQRRSDSREEIAWLRERKREHERWGREDAARTFELKRESYVDYFNVIGRYRDELSRGLDSERIPVREQYSALDEELGAARTRLDIYGSPKIKGLAGGLEHHIMQILKGRVRQDDDRNVGASKLIVLSLLRSNLLEAMRMDLGVIPFGPTPLEREEREEYSDEEDDYWDWDEDGRAEVVPQEPNAGDKHADDLTSSPHAADADARPPSPEDRPPSADDCQARGV